VRYRIEESHPARPARSPTLRSLWNSIIVLGFGFVAGLPFVLENERRLYPASRVGDRLGAQDATLRSGISQVVSMNKRGTAFERSMQRTECFGLWDVTMGVLYDYSLIALVVFGIVAQLAAAVLFVWLRRPLEAIKTRG